MKKLLLIGSVFGFVGGAMAAGFSLYEPTAAGTAYSGALMGRGIDGSANSINPATLDDITNLTVQVGFVTEHPRGRIKIERDGIVHGSKPLDPGFFVLPHFQVVAPALWGVTFGLGVSPEYGLGTSFSHDSLMTWSSKETTIQGFVVNPNASVRLTDDWAVGFGARLLFLSFDQVSYPGAYLREVNPQAGYIRNHLHGDNGFADCGFQIGTRYRLTDDFSVGVTYKSKIDVRVKGHSNLRTPPVTSGGSAAANFDIPQSVSAGFNWDFARNWHLGGMVSWTEWSTLDKLVFHLPASQGDRATTLKWKDTWRVAVAPSWDFAENWTAVLSYVYDSNTCPSDQGSTMLPPGDRQIFTGGLLWRFTDNLELGFSYGLVVMGCRPMHMNDALGRRYELKCHRGLSHAVGCTLTYRF